MIQRNFSGLKFQNQSVVVCKMPFEGSPLITMANWRPCPYLRVDMRARVRFLGPLLSEKSWAKGYRPFWPIGFSPYVAVEAGVARAVQDMEGWEACRPPILRETLHLLEDFTSEKF